MAPRRTTKSRQPTYRYRMLLHDPRRDETFTVFWEIAEDARSWHHEHLHQLGEATRRIYEEFGLQFISICKEATVEIDVEFGPRPAPEIGALPRQLGQLRLVKG